MACSESILALRGL